MACWLCDKYDNNNMRKKIIYLIFALGIVLLLAGRVSATYCCEKTTGNAWCQPASSITQCDQSINPITGDNYGAIAASCDATSYCKPGICIDNEQGTCTPNTAEIICNKNYGFWVDTNDESTLPQCQSGCCLIGDQAAFTTQIACTKMSSQYNLKVNFMSNVNDELSCLALASPQTQGACVYTLNNVKTCTEETKQDCQTRAKNSAYGNVTFHDTFLCSAQELGTNCAKTTKTICDNKGNVRFIDTCGNLANIYDSSKTKVESYWKTIQNPPCDNGKGNKNSPSCGACDYLSGSMCKQKTAGQAADTGNYICKDLDCVDYTGQGFTTNYPKHGETWCATDSKTSDTNAPGATSYKMICMNGEVTSLECDSTRQEICAEKIVDTKTGFKEANCRKNYWEDCYTQNTSEDCLDTEARDCNWVSWNGYYFTANGLQNQNTGSNPAGTCVPMFQPGFKKDGSSTATDNCGLSSAICFVKMKSGNAFGGGDWTCDTGSTNNNCSCLDSSWQTGLNGICTQLGDCGTKNNYIGSTGAKRTDIIKITQGSVA